MRWRTFSTEKPHQQKATDALGEAWFFSVSFLTYTIHKQQQQQQHHLHHCHKRVPAVEVEASLYYDYCYYFMCFCCCRINEKWKNRWLFLMLLFCEMMMMMMIRVSLLYTLWTLFELYSKTTLNNRSNWLVYKRLQVDGEIERRMNNKNIAKKREKERENEKLHISIHMKRKCWAQMKWSERVECRGT